MMYQKTITRIKFFFSSRSVLFWEIVTIFCCSFVAFTASMEADFFEELYKFSRSHEEWEIDELFSLAIIMSVALVVILYRNLKYLRIENKLRVKAEDEIKKMAFYDSLTGLPNRDLCVDRLKNVLFNAKRDDARAAVFFIDVDDFKVINDTYGHHAGDELLIAIAKRLTEALRSGDTLARVSGDEFLVIARASKNEDCIIVLAERMTLAMQAPFTLNKDLSVSASVSVSVSIGASVYPEDGNDGEVLIKNADIAMYFAKSEGKNKFKFFSSEIDSLAKNKTLLRAHLRNTLDSDELFLVYQPIVDMQTEEIKGAEVLLRWSHLTLGEISPSEFIPVAEETGLISSIGTWVFRQACIQLKTWRDAGFVSIPLSINMSARQLKNSDFAEYVAAMLKEFDIDPSLIELELTESSIMSDINAPIKSMLELDSIGVSLAMDDFGTGYSSISCLKKLKFNRLKIDKSFVDNIPDNRDDILITNTIISLANSLDLELTVEGIETKKQLDFFKKTNCGYAQGYFFSHPLRSKKFEKYLKASY